MTEVKINYQPVNYEGRLKFFIKGDISILKFAYLVLIYYLFNYDDHILFKNRIYRHLGNKEYNKEIGNLSI